MARSGRDPLIDDLTQTPPEVVAPARPSLDLFVRDVVDGDTPPQSRGRRGVLPARVGQAGLTTRADSASTSAGSSRIDVSSWNPWRSASASGTCSSSHVYT